MRTYLDTLSLLETGDVELIRSLQSLGYADELSTPDWEFSSSLESSFPKRNHPSSRNGCKEQQK